MSAHRVPPSPPPALVQLRDVEVIYNRAILALKGVTLDVPQGRIIALLGANGAGKTTTLRAISGLAGWHGAKLARGEITFDGRSVAGLSGAELVRAGIAQVMEGRRIFSELSVEENLRVGAFTCLRRSEIVARRDRVFELFPILTERRRQAAGYLSGGQQQMLAIGRALMAAPRLLLLDEPSLGLAPIIVQQIRDIIVRINGEGTTVLLVEQNADMALSISSYAYILETGRIAREGLSAALKADPSIRDLYLGSAGGQRNEVARA